MISKEEIEKAKEQLISLRENAKANIDTDEIFRLDYEAINTILEYIKELEADNKRQKEINEEHQKENGKLQEKLTRCKIKNDVLTEIIEGKAIREMGTSDLYKED